MIIYLIRTIYLSLKRCHKHTTPNNTTNRREVIVSLMETSPVMNNNAVGQRRSLHGTSSLVIHNSASLSLQEFNDLLNSLQSLQQIQTNSQFAMNPSLPPPYESVARKTSYQLLRL